MESESDREFLERLEQARRDGILWVKWSAWSPMRNWELPDPLGRLLRLARKGEAAEGLAEALLAFKQALDQDWGGKDAIRAGFAPSMMLGSAIEKAKEALAKYTEATKDIP